MRGNDNTIKIMETSQKLKLRGPETMKTATVTSAWEENM